MSELATSSMNLDQAVLQRVKSREVFICDCTLREGEQSAGAAFTLRDRIRLAHLLDEAGVRQIQAGYPGVSEDDRRVVKALAAEGLSARIESISMIHVPNWRQHIQAALECGADIVSMQFGISDIRLEKVLKMSRGQVLDTIGEAVRVAKSEGAFVSFSPTDASRADLAFLLDVYRVLVQAGADRVRITDSMGAISPTAWKYMIEQVRRVVTIPLGIHCHNDYGLAMANVCAALEAGVDWVDVVVNGLGERCGNPAMDEVVLTLEHLYGKATGVKIDKLYGLAHAMVEITGVPIPPAKPVAGENAFAHQLDTHVMGVLKNPAVYEPYPPELVGNRRRFPIGRLSGENAVRMKLGELHIDEASVDLKELISAVRRAAEARKGNLSDEEFHALLRQVGSRKRIANGE